MTTTLIEPLEMPAPHRFTRDVYQRMADDGYFAGKRVELLDGEIFNMAAQRDLHAVGIMLALPILQRVFPNHIVRCQLPLTLSDFSEPEPDFAVVTGQPRDYLGKPHPRSALLVIEIADTTLAFDRARKSSTYAAAGIADYWILNLLHNQLEIYRQPTSTGYQSVTIAKPPNSVSPLAKPTAFILIADLLP